MSNQPIAVVGAACRLPGAPNLDAFWELLVGGRDAVTEIPSDRPDRIDINFDTPHDPRPGQPDRLVSRAGGFLDDIEYFDAGFFDLSAHTALRLDPQQRLLMEVVWEALEDAGTTVEQLAGSRTGVYASCPPAGYWDLLRAADLHDIHATLTADPGAGAAGLISHHFDLRGPNMSVTAMCASSMLAVHVACRSLRAGEADLAIVGSANLLIAPDIYRALSKTEVLSPAGRCRFGDAEADGYVRSEAVIALVLKPLVTALADGDRVFGTILGTGVSSDGRTGGTIVAPGVGGHEEMLRAACWDAGVQPWQVDYVEAHGTGTAKGDRVELTALANVFRDARPPDTPCLVGSVKSNIGHTEFAAGLAGLLKTFLALRHRTVPKTLHVRRHNPVLDAPGTPLELVTDTTPWPENGRRPIAGASSFGLTGTNVHVIMTDAPEPAARSDVDHRGPYLLPLSAKTPKGLTELAGRYAELVDARDSAELRDIAFSAGTRRTHFPCRAAVVAADRRGMSGALRAFAVGARPASVLCATGRTTAPPNVVFVFPGQGAQWAGMGRELMDRDPVFAAAMRECDAAIAAETGASVLALIENEAELSTVDIVQPAVWAVQVSLARVWRALGVRPDLMIGHSMGEIAAAVAAGALTVREGATVVCRRSGLIAAQGRPGAMWAVRLGERDARAAIGELAGQVCVGVINSETTTVLSGAPDAVATVVEPLRRNGVLCRQVPVDYASHGPRVEPLRPALVESLGGLAPRAGRIPVHSTVYDRRVDGSGFHAGYWADNLCLPVRFAAAVRAALTGGPRTLFVEISPHPLLTGAITETIDTLNADAVVVASLDRDGRGPRTLLSGLGIAYSYGCAPDWAALYPGGRYVPLPSYPWQSKRFWIEPGPAARRAAPERLRPAPPPAPIHTEANLAMPRAATEPASVAEVFTRHVAEVLAAAPDELDLDLPLLLTGMDSVLATRLQHRLKRDLRLHVPVSEFLGTRSLRDVLAFVTAELEPARSA